MNNLYLKFHGMPGIGVVGKTGQSGEDGKSIYFGFINNFFDGIQIQHDAKVKLAKRNPVYYATSENNKYTELMEHLWDNIINNNFTDASIAKQIFMDYICDTSIFYSGMVYDENSKILFDNSNINSLLSYKFDIDNMPWLIAQMLSNIDTVKIINDASSFGEINISNIKILNGDATILYIDAYDFIRDVSSGGFIPSANITFDKFYLTYEPEDAANEIGHLNQYILHDFTDSSIYTVLDDMAENTSDRVYTENTTYLKEMFGSDNYVIGSNDVYAHITDSSYIFNKFSNSQYLFSKNSNYTKNAIELLDTILLDEEFYINDNDHRLTYYGIDSSILYKNKEENILNDPDAILNKICNSSLYSSSNDLNKAVNEYLDRITMSLNNKDIWNNKKPMYIRWIADEDNIVTFPSYLSEKYKEGDIIYFYTDEQDYLTSNKITNMVVITKDLLKCDINTFIAASIKSDPFEIKYFNVSNNRVECTNKIITLSQSKNLLSEELNSFSCNSINNIIGSYNDSNMILVDGTNNNQYIDIKGINNGIENSMLIKANDRAVYINSSISKYDTLLAPNTMLNSNIETFRGIYDKYIILDKYKFLKPVVEKDIYEYLTESTVYLGTKLLASDYIDTKYVDINEYIYGYELYNRFGVLVQSDVSSKDELLMYITDLYPSDNAFNEKNNTYTIVNQFTLKHNSINNKMDWDELTFKYIKFILINKNVYFIYDSETVSSNSPYDNINTIKILLSAQDLNYYTYASEYKNGKYYYDENGGIIKSLNTVYQNDVIISTDQNVIVKNVDPYHSYYYMVVFAANKNTGVKFFSKVSKIDFLVSMNNGYISDYSCAVTGDNVNLLKETKSGYIEFKSSNITSEKIDNGVFLINPNYEGITIKLIYINHELISIDNPIFKNSWANITLVEELDNSYKFIFDIDSNIPSNIYNLNTTKTTNTRYSSINEYMMSLCDSTSLDMDADLFQYLNSGKTLPSTIDRYILFSVEYTLEGSSDTIQVENYNLLQPGFKDERNIPDISINMHTSMEQLEKYNTIDNGILCNLFVTYMDINISNFDSTWCLYMDNNTSIYMDLEFCNINSDIDWISKYQIQDSLITHNTIKLIADSDINEDRSFTKNAINNYVALNTKFVNPKDNSDITYDFADIHSSIKTQADKNVQIDYNNAIYINDKQYILCDSSIMQACSEQKYLYNGINDCITININNIDSHIILDTSTFRVKIEFEMGNPIIASLYLRFALSKVVIHYNTIIDGIMQSVTFTTLIPKVKAMGTNRYIYSYSSDNKEKYKCISNPLNVMFNPVSYIACPNDKEEHIYSNILGSVKKIGNDGKISKKVSFYSSNVYSMNNLMIDDNDTIRKNLYYNWSAFRLKSKYFQDNIKSINISYIDPMNTKYDDTHKFLLQNDPVLLILPYKNDHLSDSKYLNIIYHSNIMNPKLRENEYTFYYNDIELKKDRYDQINNNCPIHVNDKNASLSIRSLELIDSMDVWNFEYLNGTKSKTDVVFNGNINKYGNGYMYINESIDIDQYGDDILSLKETKMQNNRYIYDFELYNEINNIPYNIYEPENNGYYRSFLYDLDWTYPYYNGTNVISHLIVTDFDYLIKHLISNNINIDNQYEQKYRDLIYKYDKNNARLQMIPYSLLFNISPRIAYNDDNESINVLMLRKPSIGSDNDRNNDIDCYKLNKRYFELYDDLDIIKITSPYNLK